MNLHLCHQSWDRSGSSRSLLDYFKHPCFSCQKGSKHISGLMEWAGGSTLAWAIRLHVAMHWLQEQGLLIQAWGLPYPALSAGGCISLRGGRFEHCGVGKTSVLSSAVGRFSYLLGCLGYQVKAFHIGSGTTCSCKLFQAINFWVTEPIVLRSPRWRLLHLQTQAGWVQPCPTSLRCWFRRLTRRRTIWRHSPRKLNFWQRHGLTIVMESWRHASSLTVQGALFRNFNGIVMKWRRTRTSKYWVERGHRLIWNANTKVRRRHSSTVFRNKTRVMIRISPVLTFCERKRWQREWSWKNYNRISPWEGRALRRRTKNLPVVVESHFQPVGQFWRWRERRKLSGCWGRDFSRTSQGNVEARLGSMMQQPWSPRTMTSMKVHPGIQLWWQVKNTLPMMEIFWKLWWPMVTVMQLSSQSLKERPMSSYNPMLS